MADKESNVFGALKLIEQLYLDGEIPGHVYRNILRDYQEQVNMSKFILFKGDEREKEAQ